MHVPALGRQPPQSSGCRRPARRPSERPSRGLRCERPDESLLHAGGFVDSGRMRIEVVMSEWEQACCGRAFRVGEVVTWTLLAADPAQTISGPARFREEHHGQTPDEVPHWEVTGTVRAITGVTYPLRPVTGEPRSFVVAVTETPHVVALDAVEAATGCDVSEYVIEVDVAEGYELPPFVPDPSVAQHHAAMAREAERGRARMADAVGAALESAADHAEAAFGSVADIVRESERSAVTIVPHREGATAVRWARSVREDDGIGIHTGEGSWWLPATIENAELAAVFVDAAAHGRVREDVVRLEGQNRRLDTRVAGEDGREWTASVTVEPLVTGETMLVWGDWSRVERGSVTYQAWTGPQH